MRGQVGKRHPQTADPNWRIYKVFKEIEASRLLAAYSGSMTLISCCCHSSMSYIHMIPQSSYPRWNDQSGRQPNQGDPRAQWQQSREAGDLYNPAYNYP